MTDYNFAFLDEQTKRMIRRALLKAVAIPGYQVPFGSREMPLSYGWGTGGVQVTASIIGPADILKVIDQGADDTTNAVSIRQFFARTTGVRTTTRTDEATLIQTRHRIPETPLTPGQIVVFQVPIPEPLRWLEPRETETRTMHALEEYGLSDAQLTALIDARVSDQGRYAARHRAEITRRCQARGLTLVSHDDATVAHVEEAAKIGVTIAEFPTTLEAARAARAYGLAILAGAPNVVCRRSHSGNVSALELAENGLLDILSSDYVPAALLHAAVLLHTRLGLPVAAAIATVSAAPAERAGLDDRGEIAPGRRADLVRVRVVDGLSVIRGVWRAGRRIA